MCFSPIQGEAGLSPREDKVTSLGISGSQESKRLDQLLLVCLLTLHRSPHFLIVGPNELVGKPKTQRFQGHQGKRWEYFILSPSGPKERGMSGWVGCGKWSNKEEVSRWQQQESCRKGNKKGDWAVSAGPGATLGFHPESLFPCNWKEKTGRETQRPRNGQRQ